MSMYGLQLRPGKARVAKPVPGVFNNDEDDDDSVDRELARQAARQRTLREAEQQHKRALEEDPNVFDYDGVYDEIKSNQSRPAPAVKPEAKYIHKLIEKTRMRKQEQEIVYERQLARERAKEDHLYSEKEKYVTSAYKKKLAERQQWEKEERLRAIKEAKEEVTKRPDLSDFYRNLLTKNEAFGGSAASMPKKSPPIKNDEFQVAQPPQNEVVITGVPEKPAEDMPSDSITPKSSQELPNEEYKGVIPEHKTEASAPRQQVDQREKDAEQARKRREEAARERYLARKKHKQ